MSSEIVMNIGSALASLVPEAKWYVKNDVLVWDDQEVDKPTDEAIQAEIVRLQTEYDAQEYARTRKPLYPEIGDQLDDLYHAGAFSETMAAKIKKVKDDNPKS